MNKHEIRNPKFETNPKHQYQMFQTLKNLNFGIVSCFGFRVSNLSFLFWLLVTGYWLLIAASLPAFALESPAPEIVQEISAPVQTYDQLLTAIRHVRVASKKRVERAVDQEKVLEIWETGKLIDKHVLLYKERADYGTQTMKRLSEDLETSHTELKYMLQFARTYPIGPPGDQLSWSHYRALLAVEDDTIRRNLEERAVRENWTRDRMRREVRKTNPNPEQEDKLTAEIGILNTYRVIKATSGENKDELVLDLGFSNYLKPDKKLRCAAGDMVHLEKNKLKKIKAGDEALYTYKADPIEIIDGDTLLTAVTLGFGITTVQKLRLRGLDAPEIKSSDGQEAKEFLTSMIGSGAQQSPVLIRTVKSDKYDRYLADVFVNGEYVNQKLVEEGLATVVEE